MKKINKIIVLSLSILNIMQVVGNVPVDAAVLPKKYDIYGDVNNDKKIDTSDVLLINKYRNGKASLNASQKQLADVTKDGTVDIKDILRINKHIKAGSSSPSSKIVTVYLDYGSAVGKSNQIKFKPFDGNSKLGSLFSPQQDGYTFLGWYTSLTGGSRVTASTNIGTTNQIFYAHYRINASITADKNSISLDLSGKQQNTITVKETYPKSCYIQIVTSGTRTADIKDNGWNSGGTSKKYTLTGKKTGSFKLCFQLYDSATKKVVATSGWVSVSVKKTSKDNSTGYANPIKLKGARWSASTSNNAGCRHDVQAGNINGVPVYAIQDGYITCIQKVGKSGKYKNKLVSYGNVIEFTSSDGITKAKYAHLSRFAKCNAKVSASAGYPSGVSEVGKSNIKSIYLLEKKFVRRGEIIGYVGTTGNSTGAHLHFELYIKGNRVSPEKYVKIN